MSKEEWIVMRTEELAVWSNDKKAALLKAKVEAESYVGFDEAAPPRPNTEKRVAILEERFLELEYLVGRMRTTITYLSNRKSSD